MTTLDDTQFLERARKYEVRALAEIYDRYAEPIYRYLYRIVGDAAQAEDLTSEVFCKLLNVLETPRSPNDKLQGWLYRVAHNLAMDWFREQGKAAILELDETFLSEGELPHQEVEKREMRQRLREALRKLTPAQQKVILLRYGEGFKVAQVCEVMGKSEGAVKILQHRAVNRLRKLLESEGV